jgi:hypothetical protein
MAIKPRTERRFDGSSPVGRYWLAQCEGFHVKGSTSGTVERVVGSVDPQSPEALVVRTAWRRRNVPVTAVDTVVPVGSWPSREARGCARTFAHGGRRRSSGMPLLHARERPFPGTVGRSREPQCSVSAETAIASGRRPARSPAV